MANPVSYLVMTGYAAFTILIGYAVNRFRDSGHSFSTGNRQFGWLTVGISILATYVSSMSFIGVPGWVYQGGLETLAIHLNYPIVAFVAVVFFVPVFYKLRVSSIYEYLELRFGVKARVLNSIIFIIVQCISSGVILYAVALIVVKVIPIPIYQAIIVLSVFTAIYTYFGGITTVIWTDVMQSGVLLTGCLAILYFLVGGMPEDVMTTGLAERINVLNFSLSLEKDTTLLSGLFAVTFLHLSVYGSNQLIIQRTLATRSLEDAQKSMLLCGYGSFFIYALFGAIGLLLFGFYQGKPFVNSNNIILDFVFSHTSPLVIGIVMSSLVAAAMSTLDSTFNSIATVATYDIYKRFIKPDSNNRQDEKIARRLSMACAILVIIPSLLSISNESVLKNIASLMSIFVGIRLGSFLLGLFSRTANESGVLLASLASILSIVLCRTIGLAWPWSAPVGTAVFLVAGQLSSQFTGYLPREQYQFATRQRNLFIKPGTAHYLLLVFCGLTVLLSFFVPELIKHILAGVM